MRLEHRLILALDVVERLRDREQGGEPGGVVESAVVWAINPVSVTMVWLFFFAVAREVPV